MKKNELNEMNLKLESNILKILVLSYSIHYSFLKNARGILEAVYGLKYVSKSNCWDAQVIWIDHPFDRETNKFKFLITLAGIGTVGK